jgi:serine/threonine protein kinase
VKSSLVGGTFGKYEIRRLLGRGGMGQVYEAYDTGLGRRVALKLLNDQYAQDETFRARFLRESHAAAILQEPHVIPIHDCGEIDNTLYIDMRLVQGQTLHDMLETSALEPQRAVDIIRQIASALDAAHAEGLIHRDVKPQNIIVTPDDFAYLVDFGIAEAKGQTHLTMAGYQVGSFDYMAPERFGDRTATPAVDIYSLACVLYEALTVRKPFPGPSEQVIAAHLSSPPPRPSAVNARIPVALDDVIARGMAKEPDDRYGSAGALGRAAMRALSADTSGPRAASTLHAPPTVAAPSSYPPFSAQPSYPPYAPPSYPPFNAQPSYPPTGPGVTTSPDDQRERSRGFLLPAVIAIAVVVLVVVVGVLIGVVVNRNSGSETSSPTTAYTTPGASTYPTESSSAPQPTRVPNTAAPVPQDPEQQLRQIANSDRSAVSAQLADRWVPQLSSKRPGVVDNGVVWDNAMTLQEHQQLRQKYPNVRLLWSGDWSTFSAPNFWVTVAGITFPNSAGALAWCKDKGFDRDHCIAKIVSTTHPVDGSTAYN